MLSDDSHDHQTIQKHFCWTFSSFESLAPAPNVENDSLSLHSALTMDKIKNHHSTSFFVDQLLSMSMPKMAFDVKPDRPADLGAHLPINQHSTSLGDSLSLISNCMTHDRQTLNQLNGKIEVLILANRILFLRMMFCSCQVRLSAWETTTSHLLNRPVSSSLRTLLNWTDLRSSLQLSLACSKLELLTASPNYLSKCHQKRELNTASSFSDRKSFHRKTSQHSRFKEDFHYFSRRWRGLCKRR